MTGTGWRRTRRLQRAAALLAFLCVIGARWYGIFFATAACAFTWQSTIVWCHWRKERDGIDVWEIP